jgi:hypothetical protein
MTTASSHVPAPAGPGSLVPGGNLTANQESPC